MTLGNLRGIREAGAIFAIPTYLFIGCFSMMLMVGIIKVFTHTLTPVTPPPILPVLEPVTLWLVLACFFRRGCCDERYGSNFERRAGFQT
jgi:amino acid transporter